MQCLESVIFGLTLLSKRKKKRKKKPSELGAWIALLKDTVRSNPPCFIHLYLKSKPLTKNNL